MIFHPIRLRRDADGVLIVDMELEGLWIELIRMPGEFKPGESTAIDSLGIELRVHAREFWLKQRRPVGLLP